jgi:hypothetical protein
MYCCMMYCRLQPDVLRLAVVMGPPFLLPSLEPFSHPMYLSYSIDDVVVLIFLPVL